MRIAGNHRIRIAARAGQQRFHQRRQQPRGAVDLIAQPQPHIERHLLIAAAAGMNFVRKRADALLQLADDQCMNVFVRRALEKAALCASSRIARMRRPARARSSAVRMPTPFQRARESLRAANIGIQQPAIEMQRSGERSKTSEGPSRSGRPRASFGLRFAAFSSSARTWIGRPIRLMKPRASLLIVLGAHGEAGDVERVERIRRLAADRLDAAFIEAQRHFAGGGLGWPIRKTRRATSRSGVNQSPL